jgi:hypothetical protein
MEVMSPSPTPSLLFMSISSIKRSLFTLSRHIMPKGPQTPPPPTVPTAIKSREEAKPSEGTDVATFASGCFWGTEHLFNKYYGHLPQWKVEVGYTGGRDDATDPSYQQVCSGTTKHAEAVRLHYQKGAVGYAELVEFFYRTHDPTTLNSQGPDVGTRESGPGRGLTVQSTARPSSTTRPSSSRPPRR